MAPELIITCPNCLFTAKTSQQRSVIELFGSSFKPYWHLSYRHLLGIHTFLHIDHKLFVCLWSHSYGGLVVTVHEPGTGNPWGSPAGVEISCGGEDVFSCSLSNFSEGTVEVSAYVNVPPKGVQQIIFEVDLESLMVRKIQFPIGIEISIKQLTQEILVLIDHETSEDQSFEAGTVVFDTLPVNLGVTEGAIDAKGYMPIFGRTPEVASDS
jgi:hypothetical protein